MILIMAHFYQIQEPWAQFLNELPFHVQITHTSQDLVLYKYRVLQQIQIGDCIGMKLLQLIKTDSITYKIQSTCQIFQKNNSICSPNQS